MEEKNEKNQEKDYLRIAVDEAIREWEHIEKVDFVPRICASDFLGILYLIKAVQLRLDSESRPSP